MWAKHDPPWTIQVQNEWWDNPPKSPRILEKLEWKRPITTAASGKRTMVRSFIYDQVMRMKGRLGDGETLKTCNLALTNAEFNENFTAESSKSGKPSATLPLPKARSQTSEVRSKSEFGRPCHRVVVLSSIPAKTGVNSILSQVCGGPLEKIVYRELKKNPQMELHYLSAKLAINFLNYVLKTSLFVVNGQKLTAEWATTEFQDLLPLPSYISEEVDKYQASRVIVLSKAIPGKLNMASSRKVYPCPLENFLDFNVESIKWDFVQLGGIVEIAPVISKKLCVSVQFSDIRSAILAMRSLNQKTSMLHLKYILWTAKYARDPVDRPCYAL